MMQESKGPRAQDPLHPLLQAGLNWLFESKLHHQIFRSSIIHALVVSLCQVQDADLDTDDQVG